MSEKCYELDDEVVRALYRVGWLCGMGGDEVSRYVWMYENVGVLGCKVEFVDSFMGKLVEQGWIERINVTRDGCSVFRCMPIEGILSGFERDLNEWVKNTRNVMKNLDLGVDEKWLKGTNRVEMIRFLDK